MPSAMSYAKAHWKTLKQPHADIVRLVLLYCEQVAYLLAVTALPAEFTGIFTADPYRVVKNWHICICVVAGLWGGLIIGIVTEYYTSNRYTPVQVGLRLQQFGGG